MIHPLHCDIRTVARDIQTDISLPAVTIRT